MKSVLSEKHFLKIVLTFPAQFQFTEKKSIALTSSLLKRNGMLFLLHTAQLTKFCTCSTCLLNITTPWSCCSNFCFLSLV